jgi:AAA domain
MNADEAKLTEDEQRQFDLVVSYLGAEADGPIQPWGPDNLKRSKPSLFTRADAVLAEDEHPSSWRRVDLRDCFDPDIGHEPTLLARTDKLALLYAGKRNEIHGPTESAKSWIALVAVLEVIRRGAVAVFIDWEDSPRSVVPRLLALGATQEEILDGFRYLQPMEPLTTATELDLRLEFEGAELVVIDAANEAMASAGLDPNKNMDVAIWYAKIPALATGAGATLLVIDHVSKDPASQRGAVGGAHKINVLDGASYRADAIVPFGRGSTGLVRLRLKKDRQGYLRGVLGHGQEPVAAEVAFDASEPDTMVVEIRPPTPSEETFQPTRLMEKVSRWVEDATEPVSQRDILDAVQGKRDYLIAAIAELVRGGYLGRTEGPRGAHLHTSLRPFREDES